MYGRHSQVTEEIMNRYVLVRLVSENGGIGGEWEPISERRPI